MKKPDDNAEGAGAGVSPAVRTSGNASTFGTAVPQVNARSKVLGRAQYAGDIKIAGMLHGKVLRSPFPHARIVRIDASAALALPGVKSVITGKDGPRVLWGARVKDRLTFARDVVRFAGEEVAAVAAVTDDIARDALDLIEVEYEQLPPILTPEESLAEGTPPLHPDRQDNVVHRVRYGRGDVDAGFAQADLIHEATYTTHSQYPGYLEPMASVAMVDPDGRLVVWTSTQMPHMVRARLATVLELPVSQVRVIQATTGGGFGGKLIEDANSLIAGALAMRAGRPVRLVNNRLEDFLACSTSVPEKITLKMGMDRAGRILAKEVEIIADCGGYSGLAPSVIHVSAMRSDNMHRNPNVRTHARLAYTNNPPHGAFRGYGGTQIQFALNSHIDAMASLLGLDPLEVHRINAIGPGETSVHGWQIGTCGLQECLTQCTEAVDWQTKRSAADAGSVRRRGVGLAAVMHVSGNRNLGNWDGSTVMLRVHEDGRVIIHSGEADVGQGTQTMLSQLVAHELTIPISDVHTAAPDTDVSPWAIGALASRVTIAAGNAAIVAARLAREKLYALAATLLNESVERLELVDGAIRVRDDISRRLSMAELARGHIWRHGGEGILVTGTWDPDTTMYDKDLYGNVAPAYSFAAQTVEVEVDTDTGQVTVLDSFFSDDCGKALNLLAVHGQCYGGVTQAIGWALYEYLNLEAGQIGNRDFADYTMPTADSVPALRSGLVETNEPNGPHGAKGASETPILTGAAAIANAVFNAVGVRINDLPITPEKLLEALERQRTEQRAHA